MDIELNEALRLFIAHCPFMVGIQDLVTKVRVQLERDFFLDLFYNSTLRKYAYTLIKDRVGVIGRDNAPHHKGIDNFPHHFHTEDGGIVASTLRGDPERDILTVVKKVNDFLGHSEA